MRLVSCGEPWRGVLIREPLWRSMKVWSKWGWGSGRLGVLSVGSLVRTNRSFRLGFLLGAARTLCSAMKGRFALVRFSLRAWLAWTVVGWKVVMRGRIRRGSGVEWVRKEERACRRMLLEYPLFLRTLKRMAVACSKSVGWEQIL